MGGTKAFSCAKLQGAHSCVHCGILHCDFIALTVLCYCGYSATQLFSCTGVIINLT